MRHRRATDHQRQAVCAGGIISVVCYFGHPGGHDEYVAVRGLAEALPTNYWTTTEMRVINRNLAPVHVLMWRKPQDADTLRRVMQTSAAAAAVSNTQSHVESSSRVSLFCS